MRKIAILLIGLTFTAASCNLLNDPLNTGSKGVYLSQDGGQSFSPSNAVSGRGSIDNLTVTSLLFDPFDSVKVYLGSPSGIYKSEDGGKAWQFILTGINVSDLTADPFQPGVVYASGISGSNGKIIKTLDGGMSWLDIFSEPNKNNAVTAISVGLLNRSQLVAGLASGEVIRSSDEGATWEAGEDFNDRIVKIRSVSGNKTFLLTQRKGLFMSSDQGKTWADKISDPALAISLFYDFATPANSTQNIYLATEQGLVRTQDDGSTWDLVNLPANTAERRVQAVEVNPMNAANVFANIGSTLFKSVNNGSTWETKRLDTGQAVRLIRVNPQTSNVIYLGLGGRI
ncbi:MAG: hypothetical protein HYW51_02840 [Candidatus Doudnabacteria bacterium]|nr:hypothetical protein [Candidatus Doudnabacteria bacterium]